MLKLAFTLDDAPSLLEPGVPFDATRMDRCREILVRAGVSQCVAFVVSARTEGHEAVLERWLTAGFELGNHTHAHEHVSQQTDEQFVASVTRCDALLERVGAFAAQRPKWFRFPHLDRGRDAEQRARLARLCEQLGYRVAPASLDLLDYPYEAPLAAAIARADERGAERIGRRFLRTCMRTLTAAADWSDCHEPALAQIGYAHFGPIAERHLPAIVQLVQAHGFEPCTISTAIDHAAYRNFAADFTVNGLVHDSRPRDLASRVTRRLAAESERLGLFEQRLHGPLRPR